MVTLHAAVCALEARLRTAGEAPAPARRAARAIACCAAQVPYAAYFRMADTQTDMAEAERLAARHIAGEPLAYLTGEWEFYGYILKTDPRALIPRDDSAALIDALLARADGLPPSLRLLDLCTGSGCLGIAAALELAKRRVQAALTLADISEAALALAGENAAAHGIAAEIWQMDMLCGETTDCGAVFDCVLCNPPYIPSGDLAALPRSVAEYEPHMALDGGDDGLIFYRAAAALLPRICTPRALCVFEAGVHQADAVSRIFAACGFGAMQTHTDLQGIPRAVSCRCTGG